MRKVDKGHLELVRGKARTEVGTVLGDVDQKMADVDAVLTQGQHNVPTVLNN